MSSRADAPAAVGALPWTAWTPPRLVPPAPAADPATALAPDAAAGPEPSSRGPTGLAVTGLVLPLPVVFVAWSPVLAGERGSRCPMHGEGCSPVPGDLLWALFHVSLGCGVLALTWPRTRGKSARCGVVAVRWGTQSLLGLLILTGARDPPTGFGICRD
ncbi:hypothetical protein ABZ354_25430 [Streptomyces sp. NPDC005925]|uniref:hypothetical protein n=1 Tax=Streptomyces sp. NPDC005925 TaxID=3157172 RepID=UPI0033F7D5DC